MISLATVMSKPSSLGTPFGPSAKSVYYEPQLTVVHIQRSFPCDLLYIYSQLVALLYMIVQTGSDQVVGRPNGVHVAGKVQIDILHRYDLSISAACGPAFYPEDRVPWKVP